MTMKIFLASVVIGTTTTTTTVSSVSIHVSIERTRNIQAKLCYQYQKERTREEVHPPPRIRLPNAAPPHCVDTYLCIHFHTEHCKTTENERERERKKNLPYDHNRIGGRTHTPHCCYELSCCTHNLLAYEKGLGQPA